MPTSGSDRWIVGAAAAVIGILGLFVAARAVDAVFYLFGLGLAGFAVLFVFATMKQAFDEHDRVRAASAEEAAAGEAAAGADRADAVWPAERRATGS